MKKEVNKKNNKNISNDISKIIDILLRLVIIILIIINLVNGDYDNIGVLVLTFFLTFYDFILQKIFKIKLRTPSKIMLSIFIFLAQCLGTTLDFYNIFPWWDIMLHFSSGILIYFIAIDIILIICKKNKDVKLNKFIICLFAVCFSLAISNLWEIFEFSVDNIFNLDTQKTGELVGKLAIKDTMTDLISSLCSTLLCFVITYFFGTSKIFDYE